MSVKHKNAKLRKEIGEYRAFNKIEGKYIDQKGFEAKFNEFLKCQEEWVRTFFSCRHGIDLFHKYIDSKVELPEERNKVFAVKLKQVTESFDKAKEMLRYHDVCGLITVEETERRNIKSRVEKYKERCIFHNNLRLSGKTIDALTEQFIDNCGSILSAEKKSYSPNNELRHKWQEVFKQRVKELKLTVPMAEFYREELFKLREKRNIILNSIIEAYQPFIIFLARQYTVAHKDFWDNVQEANMAVFNELESYDITQERPFKRQLGYIVRRHMYKYYMDNLSMLSMSRSKAMQVVAYKKALEDMTIKLRRIPTFEELRKKLKMSAATLEEVISLEYDIGQESASDAIEDPTIKEEYTYIDESKQEPYTVIAEREIQTAIRKMLNTLTPIEEKVLRIRFGVDHEDEGKTLEYIARIYGLTRVRILQIEQKAVEKLRHPSRNNYLRRFLL